MSKFVSFFKLCVAFLAGIGGFGYAMYCKAYVIAVAIILLVWLAWPAIKAAFKDCDN